PPAGCSRRIRGQHFFRRGASKKGTTHSGEDGESPSRCRHCKRRALLRKGHWSPPPTPPPSRGRVRVGGWEGAGSTTTRKSGNPVVGHIELPFEHKGGFVMSRLSAVFSRLCVSVFVLLLPLTIFAAEPTPEVLEEVVVSATKTPV